MLKRTINNYKVLHINICMEDIIALLLIATLKGKEWRQYMLLDKSVKLRLFTGFKYN